MATCAVRCVTATSSASFSSAAGRSAAFSRLGGSSGSRFAAPRDKLFRPRSLCSAENAASKHRLKLEAPKSFAERAQIDSGFYQGAGLLGAALALVFGTSDEQKRRALVATVETFRSWGVKVDNVPDHLLIVDHIKLNLEAARNVLLASPSFYFMWHLIHGQSVPTCVLRGLTGTIRIVPFMGAFYSLLALALPYFTSDFMDRFEQGYEEAKGNAQTFMLLSGLVCLEALVELRGCGVGFNQLRLGAFVVFVPALVGRLAAGVLTQANKVGEEFVSVLPNDFREPSAPDWKQGVNTVFDGLCLDKSFFVTLLGTSVFQHILNGTTFILLTRGKAASVRDFGRYITGGVEGTAVGGVKQLLRTGGMRFLFCLTWNWLSSHSQEYEWMDAALADLKAAEEEGVVEQVA